MSPIAGMWICSTRRLGAVLAVAYEREAVRLVAFITVA